MADVQLSNRSASVKTALELNADTNTVTDAEKTVIGNTSGTNTGDQPAADTALQPASVDSLAKLNALVLDATLIDTADSRLSDARTPTSHTHDLTGPVTSVGLATTITDDAVTYAKIQNMTTARILGRVTAATGVVEELTAAQVHEFIKSLVVLPYSLAVGDETTAITTGTGKTEFQIVHGDFELVAVYATLTTAGTGSVVTIDANLNGVSIMTTNKISIDATEKTSDTAATQPTLTTTTLTENGVVTVDFDAVDSGGVGAGPKIYLVGYWA